MKKARLTNPQTPPLAFPCPGIGLVRIWEINSPYHTNVSKSIPSSSVDTQIPLAGKVALATEPYSHAESPLFGKNAMILYKTDMTDNVTPFYDDFGMMTEVPVFNTAVAYNFPITGNSTILIINNALYIREMENNILPPIMMRLSGLLVDKCPTFLCPNPTISTHSIFFLTENNRLPLALHGTTSYISTRSPKVMSEVNEHINLVLTSENPDWDPSSPIYAQQQAR